MKKMFFLFLTVLLVSSTAVYSAQMESMERESQNQDPETWDFGKVKEGQVVKHTFLLKNETDKLLKIKNVSTSCGCTASKMKKKVLKAGEVGEIEVMFDSNGYTGNVKQFVYVHTDDIDKSVIRYIIKAEVVK